MKEISLIAATVYGNRGAEAMICSTIGRLRNRIPNARFHVFSYYPDDDRKLVADPAVTIHSATPRYLVTVLAPLAFLLAALKRVGLGRVERFFPASVQALSRSKVLLDMAGVSFIDGREKFLPYNTLTLWPAMMLGVPVVKLAQAIGPVTGRLNRLAASLTLPHCRWIFARGGSTYANLADCGDVAVEMAADIAFLYRPEYSLSSEFPADLEMLLGELDRNGGRQKAPVVGICPSSVVAARARKTGDDYAGLIAHLVASLTEKGCRVILFPNATRARYGDAERNNDIPVIREVAARLAAIGAPSVPTVTSDINTHAVRELVSRMDLVVTSRFHAMVAALALKVPVSVIGWSHKYIEVMQDFGQESQARDWQDSKPDEVVERIVGLLDSREAAAARIAEALPGVQNAASAQFDAVVELINGG